MQDSSYQIITMNTETKMSSFWRNFHHWLHWKLSFWQLPVQPVMNISSKWRLFRFSEYHSHLLINLYSTHMQFRFTDNTEVFTFHQHNAMISAVSDYTLRPGDIKNKGMHYQSWNVHINHSDGYNSLRPSDAFFASENYTIINSDNGLSPGRRQAIIWANAGILLIGPLGAKFSELLI